MSELDKILSTLYNAVDSPSEAPIYISEATGLISDYIMEIDSPMLSRELSDIVNVLSEIDYDIDSVIYELEVIKNER